MLKKPGKRDVCNYLPGQYAQTNPLPINHNYLVQQFADYRDIFSEIERLVRRADFTLGEAVGRFESRIRELTGSAHALGVGSGTDALFMTLKALGIGEGDEVITTPYTFVATIGAIVTAGARPVFVDVRDDYNIDRSRIEAALTERTRAILPVHWSGLPCEMDEICAIADARQLPVVEDSCHGIRAEYRGRPAGTFGVAGCFSMHPLKNLNVWGDGGYVITDSDALYERLALLRNHGLVNRDTCEVFGYNSRLDSLQAVVANHLLKRIDFITESRIAHAALYDKHLGEIDEITVPQRPRHCKQVYHIYVIRAQRRDELQQYLVKNGIDAKVHYPIPMHLQPAAAELGYQRGDFPVCEAICDSVLSLPVHEYITEEQIEYVAATIRQFYAKSSIRRSVETVPGTP